MLIVVLVKNLGRPRVVRRVDIDALDLLAVLLQKQAEGLEVLAVNQQAVGLAVQIINAGEQSVHETAVEVPGVEDQRRMGPEEGDAALLPALAAREQVRCFLVDVEQLLPLGPLRLAGGYLRVELLADIADGDAVLRLGDELPLLPEHLLEFLDLVEEFDDPAPHGLD